MTATSSGSGYNTYLDRAEECRRKAAVATSPVARARYLDSANRWASLAHSYIEAPSIAPEADAALLGTVQKTHR